MSWLPNWLTGYDEDNVAAGNDATEKLRALNAKKNAENPEVFTDEWLAETERNLSDDYIDPNRAAEEIDGAFWEGWNEGADKIRNGIGSTINTAAGSAFRIVPWQVWVIGLGFAAWKLGLFKGLLKKSA